MISPTFGGPRQPLASHLEQMVSPQGGRRNVRAVGNREAVLLGDVGRKWNVADTQVGSLKFAVFMAFWTRPFATSLMGMANQYSGQHWQWLR